MAEINLLIPKERVGALIGSNGEVKKRIETTLKVELTVDSAGGRVLIKEGAETHPLNVLKAKDVVSAISQGFSPERSFILFDDDKILNTIDLREIFGRNDNQISRIKGRIIGREGKSRRLIEQTLGAILSIYGHTISIIGSYERVIIAREAIQMLIQGSQHASVFRFLRLKRAEVKKKSKTELWEKPI